MALGTIVKFDSLIRSALAHFSFTGADSLELGFTLLLTLGLLLIFLRELARRAPLGYEDATGFHPIPRRLRRRPVSRIRKSRRAPRPLHWRPAKA